MKIPIPQNLNPAEIMRRAGYGFLSDRRSGLSSFTRRLGNGFYPRFHAYIEGDFIKLHLDQKQASYAGSRMHSGEHEGEAVEAEAGRIEELISKLQNQRTDDENNGEKEEKKKNFWDRWFK